MDSSKIINFIGSLLVIAVAIMIFFMLMSNEMPSSNRELLIAFVSVLFGSMAGSIKRITGEEDSQMIKELTEKNKQLEQKIQDLENK